MSQYYKHEDSNYIYYYTYYTKQLGWEQFSGYQKLCRSDYVVKKDSLEVIKSRNPNLIQTLLENYLGVQGQRDLT